MRATPSITDVASLSGVSRQVVSVILSGRESKHIRFSDQTRIRVIQAVQELGYRPNRSAQQMHNRRHNTLALLSYNLNTIPNNALEWLVSEASKHEQLLVMERLPHDPEADQPRIFREDYADAILLFEDLDETMARRVKALGVPVIWANTSKRFCPGSITFDLEGVSRQIVSLLKDRGRTQIACVFNADTKPSPKYPRQVRFDELTRASIEQSVGAPLRWDLTGSFIECAGKLSALLDTHSHVDTLVLNSQQLGEIAYAAATMAQRPLRIGDNLSILGYANVGSAASVAPELTTVRVIPRILAEETIALALSTLEQPLASEPAAHRVLPFEIRITESI